MVIQFHAFVTLRSLLILDTTRSPREGELNGREYHFVPLDEFLRLMAQGSFIEYTHCIVLLLFLVTLVSSNYYGTTIEAIQAVSRRGKQCILDLDMEVRSLEAITNSRVS